MRTTLDLDDTLLRRARIRAAEQSKSLTKFIEDALAAALLPQHAKPKATYKLEWPVPEGGELLVDPADRNALYADFDRDRYSWLLADRPKPRRRR